MVIISHIKNTYKVIIDTIKVLTKKHSHKLLVYSGKIDSQKIDLNKPITDQLVSNPDLSISLAAEIDIPTRHILTISDSIHSNHSKQAQNFMHLLKANTTHFKESFYHN